MRHIRWIGSDRRFSGALFFYVFFIFAQTQEEALAKGFAFAGEVIEKYTTHHTNVMRALNLHAKDRQVKLSNKGADMIKKFQETKPGYRGGFCAASFIRLLTVKRYNRVRMAACAAGCAACPPVVFSLPAW